MERKTALHDWTCDACGRKVYNRRKPPKRCHAWPMRPLGDPWRHVVKKFLDHYGAKTKRDLLALPDDYWISERVIAQLQVVADAQGLWWHNSVQAAEGYNTTETYDELI